MSSEYRLDRYPIVLLRPRLSYPYSWVGHIPFAYLLVDLLRPRSFVELGTHSGNSYLAVCQAVTELGIETKCTAVDSWEGDAHALIYGSDVLANLKAYHDPRYAEFSNLSQKFFEDAVLDFEEGSIDLLHIDGLHTYEAVKTDFETWLPKLSDRAVVILHDCEVREREFGVWRYVEELETKYRTFRFLHSNGLAVVEVGANASADFKAFMAHALDHPAETRGIFETIAGTLLDNKGRPASAAAIYESVPVVCRIYMADEIGGFSEKHSFQKTILEAEGRLEVEFATGTIKSPAFLRVDFSETPGVFSLHRVALVLADGSVVVVDRLPERVSYSSGALLKPPAPGAIRLAGFDQDPHIEVRLDTDVSDSGSLLTAVRLSLDYEIVMNDPNLWSFMDKAAEVYSEVEISRSQVAGISRAIDNFANQLAVFEGNQNATISSTNEQLHHLTLESSKASGAFATTNAILSELTTQMDHLLRQSAAQAAGNHGEALARSFDLTAGTVDRLATQVTSNSADIGVLNTVLADATSQLHALCGQVSRSASDTGMMNDVLSRVTSTLHQLTTQVSESNRFNTAVNQSLCGIVDTLGALQARLDISDGAMREVEAQSNRIEALQQQQEQQARELTALKEGRMLQRLKRLVGHQ